MFLFTGALNGARLLHDQVQTLLKPTIMTSAQSFHLVRFEEPGIFWFLVYVFSLSPEPSPPPPPWIRLACVVVVFPSYHFIVSHAVECCIAIHLGQIMALKNA